MKWYTISWLLPAKKSASDSFPFAGEVRWTLCLRFRIAFRFDGARHPLFPRHPGRSLARAPFFLGSSFIA